MRHKRKVPKVQLLNYLVHLLLPVLEKINEEQRIEVEIEANISGTVIDFTLWSLLDFEHLLTFYIL